MHIIFHTCWKLTSKLFGLLISLLLASCVLGAPPGLQFLPDISGLDGRIIGGEDTTIEDYPYQISILELGSHRCGESIITNDYVVTAAHCLRYAVTSYSVRAGSSIRNSGGVVVAASEIFVHPDYNSAIENDIAVVRLASSLTFSESIAPVLLPPQDQEIPSGADAVVTGWGDLVDGAGQGSNVLQAVTVPIVNQPECAEYYTNHRLSVTESMICVGFVEGGKDACQGDSGGPLVVDGVLVGVVSWGEGCAVPNYPGVYASVPYLRSFINQNTGI